MVVTVLLSDHYSKSRQSMLASDTPTRPTLVPNIAPEPDPAPSEAVFATDPTGRLGGPVGPELPLTGPGEPIHRTAASGTEMTAGAADPNLSPVEFSQGSQDRDEQNRLLRQALAKALDRATDRLAGNDRSSPEALKREFAGGVPSGEKAGGPGVDEPVQPQATDRVHVIASGDTLIKVARKYYNDGNMWKQLAAYNSDIAGKDGQVRAGAKLKIPSVEVLAGRGSARPPVREPAPSVITGTPAKPMERSELKLLPKDAVKVPAASAVAKNSPAKSSPTKSVKYTVRKGDTLREIAREQLGSVARAAEIIELNRKILKDPNNVPAGAVLTLPSQG